MKQIPECFQTTPIVYAVGRNYQIMVPVTKETLMWAEIGGKCYYDDVNGIMRSNCTTHRMTVPMEAMDAAGEYKICYRIVKERKPYFSEVGDVCEYHSVFYPVKGETIRFYHIADAHNEVEKPVEAAKAYGKIDFLILNGDLPNHSGEIANFATIHKIAAEITNGEIPVVFARGNHDMRGIYAENIAEHTPTDHGRSYYTFRLGSLWGMVLDCGEDKLDAHAEYAHTICCTDFRQRQTAWMQSVIDRAAEEYIAEGVDKRIVVCHDPFTEYQTSDIVSEQDIAIYMEWARLLREHIRPQIMICGHIHKAYITPIGGELDKLGQPCPVIIGCAPGTSNVFKEGWLNARGIYIGAGFETSDDGFEISFVGDDSNCYEERKITY